MEEGRGRGREIVGRLLGSSKEDVHSSQGDISGGEIEMDGVKAYFRGRLNMTY